MNNPPDLNNSNYDDDRHESYESDHPTEPLDAASLRNSPLITHDTHAGNDDVTEALTAYLDGELNASAAMEIENRLARDPQFRSQLQSLQSTWDLLDGLSEADLSDDFVKTTMELVVAESLKDRIATPYSWGKFIRNLVFVVVPFSLLLISFFTSRNVQTQRHRQLVAHFHVIENLDHFDKLNYDFDFLIQLDELELFSREFKTTFQDSWRVEMEGFDTLSDNSNKNPIGYGSHTKLSLNPVVDSLHDISQHIKELEPREYARLKRNFQNFSKMNDSEKELAQLFLKKLQSHENPARLQLVARAYSDWLRNLGNSEKFGGATKVASILDAPDNDNRIKLINQVKAAQLQDAFGRIGFTRLPSDGDASQLLRWFDLSIHSNLSQIRQEFPEVVMAYYERMRRYNPEKATVERSIEQIRQFARRNNVEYLVAIALEIDRAAVANWIANDIELLPEFVSFQAGSILDQQDPQDRKELVLTWVEEARSAEEFSPAKLQRFYEQLPIEQRDKLDQLPADEWHAQIHELYWEDNQTNRELQRFMHMIIGQRP